MPAEGEAQDILISENVIDATSSNNSDASNSDNDSLYEEYPINTGKILEHAAKPAATKNVPAYQSIPSRENHETFIKKCVDILLKEAVFEGTKRENRVVEWHSPDELRNLLDFSLRRSAVSHEELMSLMKGVIRYSVKVGHPYFANQLFSSVDPYGLIGQWLTDALNPSVYTYEVAPVFTLMEETVLHEMRVIVGFEKGKGDGIFCPGGSMANGYAISCARHKFLPDIKVSAYTRYLDRRIIYRYITKDNIYYLWYYLIPNLFEDEVSMIFEVCKFSY